jgi:NAD(P)-dependent dehydrogenase (short-subunit alcohol dehydrogenase family)
MRRGFRDRSVWITGGGSGIGEALALELGRRGAWVAVSGRRIDRLEAVVRRIEEAGGRAKAVGCDVTDEAAVEAAVDEVVRAFGRLDVAVANAGMGVSGRVEALTARDWRFQFDVNVVGAALTGRFALGPLRQTRGRLVLVGSAAAYLGAVSSGAYCASKAALRSLGQTLRLELAGSGVSVTSIHPGFIESEIGQVDNRGVHHPDREDRRPQRLMWTAERAARVMARAILRRRREFVFTGHGRLAAFFGQHFPGLLGFVQSRSASS